MGIENREKKARDFGRIGQHDPTEYVITRLIKGDVPFGALAQINNDCTVSVYEKSTLKADGIALYNTGGDIDNNKFIEGNVGEVLKNGIPIVETSEDVTIADPVRWNMTTRKFCKSAVVDETVLLTGAEWIRNSEAGRGYLRLSGYLSVESD